MRGQLGERHTEGVVVVQDKPGDHGQQVTAGAALPWGRVLCPCLWARFLEGVAFCCFLRNPLGPSMWQNLRSTAAASKGKPQEAECYCG